VILVDTSVWIDHLRAPEPQLSNLLAHGQVLAHPFVIGEIALGQLPERRAVLSSLQALPQAVKAHDNEVMEFVERHALFAIGIGYVDVHLLASARLSPGGQFWTRDKRLRAASERLQLSANLD